jgi:hypothetical protein
MSVAAPCARLQFVRGPVRKRSIMRPFNTIVSRHGVNMRTLLLIVAILVASNASAMTSSATGTWKYEDPRVSMTVRLDGDGACRVTAKLDGGLGIDALCTYAIYGDAVVLAWPGFNVISGGTTAPIRLLFDPTSDTFAVEGEPERVLTRSGVVKL